MRQCRHRNAIALAVSSRVLLFLSRSRPAGLPRSLSRCHYPEAKSPVIGNGSEVTLDYQVIVFGDSGIPYHGTSEFVQGRQAESPLAIEVPGILPTLRRPRYGIQRQSGRPFQQSSEHGEFYER